jgi:hypothetical protein
MKGVDRQELNNATLVTYALVRALLDELPDVAKRRVIQRSLSHLPPRPVPLGALPADDAMWKDAERWLKKLAEG